MADINNWVCIYSTTVGFKAEILKDVLNDQGIQTVLVDKKDSAYVTIGEIELYVQRENVIKAKHILSKKDLDL